MKMRLLLFSLFIIHFSPVTQAMWPTEADSTVRNRGYGSACVRCTGHFSDGYCTPDCCTSCQSIAGDYGLTTDQACSGICRDTSRIFTTRDRELAHLCQQPDADTNSRCDGVTEFVDVPRDPRPYEQRVISCNESVEKVKQSCTANFLNSVIPVDMFNLAKQISEAPSCDIDKINQFNLNSTVANPRDALAQCETHYNSCKTYCFDQNSVDGRTYSEGQTKYQDICQPWYAQFEQEKGARLSVIEDVSTHIQGCTGDVSPNRTADDGSGGALPNGTPDNGSAQAKGGGQGADGVQTGKNGWNNPSGVFSNMSQLMNVVQQFLPQNTAPGGAGTPVQYTANPILTRSQMTDEQYYGEPYEGEPDPFDDDADFSGGITDLPTNLKNTASNNRQNQGRGGMGGGAGGFSGMGGVGGGSNPNKGKKTAGRGRPATKDKTLFGKRQSSTGGASFASTDDKGKTITGYNSKYGVGGANPNIINNKRQFNASKYHDQILASYQKGINSKAQDRALRRAAGLTSEDPNGFSSRGYDSWHLENKIHPESVSLFMQMRVCYNKKYASGFAQTCEPRR